MIRRACAILGLSLLAPLAGCASYSANSGLQKPVVDMKGVDLGRLGIADQPKVEKKTTEISDKMFKKGGGKNSCMFDNPKWAIIAKAFVDIDKAETTQDKIKSIDFLNDLQQMFLPD